MQEVKNAFETMDSRDFYDFIRKKVHGQYRRQNVKLLDYLSSLITGEENEKQEKLLDILDAMTGYCAKDCWIGTGDYHIK